MPYLLNSFGTPLVIFYSKVAPKKCGGILRNHILYCEKLQIFLIYVISMPVKIVPRKIPISIKFLKTEIRIL